MYTREGQTLEQTGTDDKGRPIAQWMGPCTRCGGCGRHAHNGEHDRCYRCDGKRSMTRDLYTERLYTADELAVMNVRRHALRAKKAAKAAAIQTEREAADEAARAARCEALKSDPLFQELLTYAARNEFLGELLGKLRVRDLSPAQVEAAEKAIVRIVAKDKSAATSKHIGAVGERVALTLRCTFVRCIHQASVGTWINGRPDVSRWLNKFETEDGSVVVLFSSTAYTVNGLWMRPGTATVKEHSTYEGVAQTLIKNLRLKKGDDNV